LSGSWNCLAVLTLLHNPHCLLTPSKVLEDSGVSDVLELNTYLTSIKGPSEADGDAEYGRDPITGLRVHYLQNRAELLM